MTFSSLLNWGSFGNSPAMTPIERYHSGSGGYWEHKSHGHGHKSGGKGGGSSAALSALTLLAFLFLINVMQQSLQDNNSTAAAGTGTTAVLLRDGQQQPVSLNAREETNDRPKKSRNVRAPISSNEENKNSKIKGETLQRGPKMISYT